MNALLAHGKNWELPIPDDPARIRASLDTRLTAEAAGILFTAGEIIFDRLILSTGHTAGPAYPSEAQAMRGILRERFDESQIPNEVILMEEESFDTAGNLQRVNELCREHNIGSIALLTIGYHLPRTQRLARRLLDVPVIGAYKSNTIVQQDRGASPHLFYARSIASQTLQTRSLRPVARVMSSLALEGAAWSLTLVDPTGEGISNKITSRIRHQK